LKRNGTGSKAGKEKGAGRQEGGGGIARPKKNNHWVGPLKKKEAKKKGRGGGPEGDLIG